MGRARCDLLARGVKYEFGSLEERLAVSAINRQNEIEFLKLMSIINAIIGTGNTIAQAVSGGQSSGNDALNKAIDELKNALLPHWAEEKDKRAKKAFEILSKETSQGPIHVQVVGKNVR